MGVFINIRTFSTKKGVFSALIRTNFDSICLCASLQVIWTSGKRLMNECNKNTDITWISQVAGWGRIPPGRRRWLAHYWSGCGWVVGLRTWWFTLCQCFVTLVHQPLTARPNNLQVTWTSGKRLMNECNKTLTSTHSSININLSIYLIFYNAI